MFFTTRNIISLLLERDHNCFWKEKKYINTKETT